MSLKVPSREEAKRAERPAYWRVAAHCGGDAARGPDASRRLRCQSWTPPSFWRVGTPPKTGKPVTGVTLLAPAGAGRGPRQPSMATAECRASLMPTATTFLLTAGMVSKQRRDGARDALWK